MICLSNHFNSTPSISVLLDSLNDTMEIGGDKISGAKKEVHIKMTWMFFLRYFGKAATEITIQLPYTFYTGPVSLFLLLHPIDHLGVHGRKAAMVSL